MKTVKFTSEELIIVATKICPAYGGRYRAEIKNRVISALIKAEGFEWNDNKYTNENLIAYCNQKGFGNNLKKAAEEFEKLIEKRGYINYTGIMYVINDLADKYSVTDLTVELKEEKKPALNTEKKRESTCPKYEKTVNLDCIKETVTCVFCGKVLPSKWKTGKYGCSIIHDDCSCSAAIEAAARNKTLEKEYKEKVAEEENKKKK